VELRVLGEVEVWSKGLRVALPPSKKTRALLAWLALTGRAHRRDRLCELLWDVADDPRAALRWSLTKLRGVVDSPGARRIAADREAVRFEPMGAVIDFERVRAEVGGDPARAPTDALERAAARFRGELLTGVDLPDFHEFQAWCVALREDARILHVRILRALVARLAGEPEAALGYARAWVSIDPFDESARATLIRLLAAAGRTEEAAQQHAAGQRMAAELGHPSGALDAAWSAIPRGPVAPKSPQEVAAHGAPPPLVGRRALLDRLLGLADDATASGSARVVLLRGEPGVGKTRLLHELARGVTTRGGDVLRGAAFEAEVGRPYGPWIDALRTSPAPPERAELREALAPLLSGLAEAPSGTGGRDRLYGAVVELIHERAAIATPLLIALDDVQWCDPAAASLLHFVARMSRSQPVLIALAARDGELPDNDGVLRAVRGLRRDLPLDEIDVPPLDRAGIEELVASAGGAHDPERIFEASAGNPLFALELARADTDEVPATLSLLVRDRLDRLEGEAADLLRWAAVLGPIFQVERLEGLIAMDFQAFDRALLALERHGLVGPSEGEAGAYAFRHDVVRTAVLTELSEPRRRRMHGRVAALLHERGEPSLAAEIAHHASRAGASALAVDACVVAAARSLRVFASEDAQALARRGLAQVEALEEPARTARTLELLQILYTARPPSDTESAAAQLVALAERALDLGEVQAARLGFHVVAYLRWDVGDPARAQQHMMRAEQITRGADERQRVVAMSEAARCLTLLERDLGQAEAWVLEARALGERLGVETDALHDAVGMLRLHRGALDEAREHFLRARDLARLRGDRLREFQALEHLVWADLHEGRYGQATAQCEELLAIGERLREGSEAPFARTLCALSRCAASDEADSTEFEARLSELRAADSKQRLVVALTTAAAIALDKGEPERAGRWAAEARELAQALGRRTDAVVALALLARSAQARGDDAAHSAHTEELGTLLGPDVAAHAVRLARGIAGAASGR
jgi:DNA-binding SARP family transcriptional activator/tetratricopeptide (TPR) repeat protein